MKTKITHTLAVIVMASIPILTSISNNVSAQEIAVKTTGSSTVKSINKIIVSGNVEVYLSQGYKDDLKVYDNSKDGLVESKEGVLYLTSTSKEKERLEVWITVTDLTAIEASGNAIIIATDKLSCIDLDIKLKDSAKAIIEVQSVNFYSVVGHSSSLELLGETENQKIELSGFAKLNVSKFTAQNRSVIVSDNAIAYFNQGLGL